MSKRRRAIVFCNGIRTRTVEESGGSEVLFRHFDVFVDVSAFAKPWDAKLSFSDRIYTERAVHLETPDEARTYFNDESFDYVLIVGLEWSRERTALIEAIANASDAWGVLFVRGDARDLFNWRRYDMRGLSGLRQRLRRWNKARRISTPPPAHLFTNEPRALDFPEVTYGKTQIVKLNHNDAQRLARAVPAGDTPTLVFADQALTLTFSDDPANVGEERFFTSALANRYHAALGEALDALGKSRGLPVVACLHPNSSTRAEEHFPKSIEVVRGKTVEHILPAELVVTHTSMVTGICHLLGKPTILLSLSSDLMPPSVMADLRRKARNEGLVRLNWPEDGLPSGAIPPASNPRIVEFLRPLADCPDFGTVFERHL